MARYPAARDVYQERYYGGSGRGVRGGRRPDARSSPRLLRHHDHRSVPPTLRKTPACGTLRNARRVRRMEKDRRSDGLQTRRIIAADAKLVSRPTAGREWRDRIILTN